MKYIVSVAIEGRIDVEVEADDIEEARQKAIHEAGNTDWNCMDLVDCTPVNAEDEHGVLIDY